MASGYPSETNKILGNILSVLGSGGYSYPFPLVTTAERSALTGMKIGAHVLDTDISAVYVYNGSIWVQAYNL